MITFEKENEENEENNRFVVCGSDAVDDSL